MTSIRRKKSKFINVQRHAGSCGPIAVANAIKWHGIETSYVKVLKFCSALQAYNSVEGMWPYQLSYVLKTLKMKFKIRRKFDINRLDDLLASGGACILVYETPRGGHAVFIDLALERGYRAWNRKLGHLPFFSINDMKKALNCNSSKVGGLYVYCFQALRT